VDKDQLEFNLVKIRSIIKEYSFSDIYNIDETALYYKFSPNNSLASKQLPSNTTDKSGITANFCCNADSSYKLDILFIIKALRPHAFKGIKRIGSLNY
jgi:hypothetical protein